MRPPNARTDVDRPASSGAPRRLLGMRQATALIVGVVIGAGIFESPSIVAGLSGSADWMFGMWLLGSLISLVSALCYAELTTAYPHPGGDYNQWTITEANQRALKA